MGASSDEPVERPRPDSEALPAVFLDRDGVLIDLAFDKEDQTYESPISVEQISLANGAAEGVAAIREAGWEIVVVSNQPVVAKGKVTEEGFEEMHGRVVRLLADEGVEIDHWRYCFHHPKASVESLRGPCRCRKPKPGMILEAADELGLDLQKSWMIGDSDTDIEAGRAAGCKTLLIEYRKSAHRRSGAGSPDLRASNLMEAVPLLPDPSSQHHRR